MADTQMLAIDMKLSRRGDDDVRTLAVGLDQLYERARREWGDRRYTQNVTVNGDEMSVVLSAYPDV